ncbi:RTX toxin acyltransferase family protein [compost metagenome]
MSFNDWNSGEDIWLVDVVAPFGGIPKIMEDLRHQVFAGKAMQQLAPTTTEPTKVVTWPAV